MPGLEQSIAKPKPWFDAVREWLEEIERDTGIDVGQTMIMILVLAALYFVLPKITHGLAELIRAWRSK